MSEKITDRNWGNPAYHFTICAITKYYGGVITDDKFQGDLHATLTVNGVEIPFHETLADVYARYQGQVDSDALELAKSMVTAAGLDGLQEALRQAEYEMVEALEGALKKLKDTK